MHAKVVPVYKGEHKTDPSNYRPIFLLSVFNRIFEKTMYRRLMAYLEINGILCDSQYGFREKHSTQHALIDRVNQVQSHFDKGMLSCGVFIDLKKAFDTLDHCILLQKLYHYGIRGIINDWVHSYLTDRVNQLKLVQRFLLNSLRPVVSFKGPCWGLYYSSCTSTIYVDHLINCRFTYLLMILICYMLIEILIPLKELSMPN